MDGGKIRSRVLRVTRGDPSPFLQAQKGVLHQVTLLVEMLVVIPLLLAVLSRRNDRLHVFLGRQVEDAPAVVSLVRYQEVRLQRTDQEFSLRTICSGTFCNKRSERIAMRIHGQVYLGVEPPFVRPMAWLPPLAPTA